MYRILAALLLAVSSLCLADVVHVMDGGKLVGKILEETDEEVVILTVKGIVARIPVERVERIERGSLREIYERQMKSVDKNSAGALYGLARWCRDVGLVKESEDLLRRVLALEPDHEEARWALGYMRRGGRWLSEEEWRAEQGFVRYRGEWVKKEDLEKIKAGYVRWRDEWVSKEDYEKLRKGMRKVDGRWMSEEEYWKSRGYVKRGGKWVSEQWLKKKEEERRSKPPVKKRPKYSKGRGGRAGTYTQKIKIEGTEREFVVSAPKWAAGGKPAPLLVLLHGTNSRPQYMLYHFNPVVRGGAIIAAPWALGGKWLVGADASKHDDEFVMKMVEWVKKHYNVALSKIYLAGHSRGGFYTFRLGVRHGDVFAACGVLMGGDSGYADPSERKAPFYIYIVERDPNVSVESARRAKAVLEENGHQVEYHEVPGGTGTAQDHELRRECCQECWDFMKKHVLK